MDLTIRDLMVIAGVLLILGVALDAARRISSERYSRSRTRSAGGYGDPMEDEVEDDELFWPRELPNGPARVVQRGEAGRSAPAAETASAAPVAKAAKAAKAAKSARSDDEATSTEAVSEARTVQRRSRPEPEPVVDDADDITPVAGGDDVELVTGIRADDRVQPSNPESARAQDETPEPAEKTAKAKRPRKRRSKKAAAGGGDTVTPLPVADAAAQAPEPGEPRNIDWLEDMGGDSVNASRDSASVDDDRGRLPRGVEPEIFMLNVIARSPDGFRGEDILHILLACGLRFGDMDFFHRHEDGAGRGPIQFSVANMMQPGVFDLDAMDDFRTPGLVFFVTLPGPDDMTKAFDYMLETAQAVARNLDGDVLDESRSVITRQTLEHARQRIRDLERRLLARASG